MESREKRRRRALTPEFEAEVVELCRRGDRAICRAARDLDRDGGAGVGIADEAQHRPGHPEVRVRRPPRIPAQGGVAKCVSGVEIAIPPRHGDGV
jgi:hypothetical protein